MVVVVIIGVLVAIAVPVYNNTTDKAKLNAIAANLRIINGAISQYQANSGGTTPTAAQLVPNYIQTWPTNPKGVTYKIDTVDFDILIKTK
jgi:type IV pilus assembly protein PilA